MNEGKIFVTQWVILLFGLGHILVACAVASLCSACYIVCLFITFLLYGPPFSGNTSISASFPLVFIFSRFEFKILGVRNLVSSVQCRLLQQFCWFPLKYVSLWTGLVHHDKRTPSLNWKVEYPPFLLYVCLNRQWHAGVTWKSLLHPMVRSQNAR